jgi:hypothetical protein
MKTLVGALTLLLLASGPAWAEVKYAGSQTVADWRFYSSDRDATLYAYGVVTMQSMYLSCSGSKTVAELEAYLMHRANPEHTLKQALSIYFGEMGCTAFTGDQRRTLR